MPNLRLPLDLWCSHESGMVLVLDSESRLVLHAKRDKVKLTFFIVNLEKCDFLETTVNIDILYTVRKYFLS